MDMPAYFASQFEQYLEISQENFDSCIQDGHMYHCPFDLPINYHYRQCVGAVFSERHQNILEYCRFQINPVYEGEIVQEVRPGEYLMSTGNQTWVRDCPDGAESIDSCAFCIVPLHCNCWLHTEDQYLAGTLDTCLIDDIYPNVTYVPNTAYQYFVEPDKYHPDKSLQPQTNRDHESNKKFQVLNANMDKIEEQWVELNSETVQPGKLIDVNQVATKVRRPLAHQIFVAMVIVVSILGPLILLVLALVIVFKKVVSRMKTEHLNAAGFFSRVADWKDKCSLLHGDTR